MTDSKNKIKRSSQETVYNKYEDYIIKKLNNEFSHLLIFYENFCRENKIKHYAIEMPKIKFEEFDNTIDENKIAKYRPYQNTIIFGIDQIPYFINANNKNKDFLNKQIDIFIGHELGHYLLYNINPDIIRGMHALDFKKSNSTIYNNYYVKNNESLAQLIGVYLSQSARNMPINNEVLAYEILDNAQFFLDVALRCYKGNKKAINENDYDENDKKYLKHFLINEFNDNIKIIGIYFNSFVALSHSLIKNNDSLIKFIKQGIDKPDKLNEELSKNYIIETKNSFKSSYEDIVPCFIDIINIYKEKIDKIKKYKNLLRQ